MKKSLKRVFLLALILTIISTITILLLGKTYTIKFMIKTEGEHSINTTTDTGKIKILKETKTNDTYKVKIKGVEPGSVYMECIDGDLKEGRIIYIHKSMVITDNNYFGKATGSEIIPISITIFLGYILYLLNKEYKRSCNENIYQYKNIAYLGIILFLSLYSIYNLNSIINYQGLYETINIIINSSSLVSFFLYPIAIVVSILVIISNIQLIIKEGRTWKNLLGLFLGIFICFSTILPNYVYKLLLESQKLNIYNLNGPGPYLYNFVESLVYLSVSYLECILIGTIILAIKAIKKKVKYDKDYMIILGCKIRKDGSLPPLLKGRVDRAIAFQQEQLKETGKSLVFIPSGGQGKDEEMAEAEAIKNYLLKQKIKEKNILVENKSRNTYENIKNSIKLIKEKDVNIAFSTTNYHVLRAGLIATEQGYLLEGIGSKTKSYLWINAFIREFIGTIYTEKKKHILVISILIAIIIFMIGLTFIANNH